MANRGTMVVWLRRFLLLILVGVLGGVAALYWFGRSGQPETAVRPPADAPEVQAGGDVATVGRGFDYTHYREGEPAFTLKAERTVEDREATVFLERVELTVYQQEGEENRGYSMSAQRAQYNRERQEAVLLGDVVVSGSAGLELTTERLQLAQEGRLLVSPTPVELSFEGRYRAVGQTFRVHLPEDLFQLIGQVRVENVPGLAPYLLLTCERLILERQRQLLRAEGGVVADRSGEHLEARSLNAFLTEDLSSLRFVRARWDVLAWRRFASGPVAQGLTGPPQPTLVELTGRSLSALMQPGGAVLESAELEGSPQDPATLRTSGQDGTRRVVTAGYLTTQFQSDGSQLVEAFGEPEVVESLPGGGDLPASPDRRLAGGQATAEIFPDGSFGEVRLAGGVDYRDGEVELTAEHGRFDVSRGAGTFYGTEARDARPSLPLVAGSNRPPVERVQLESPRGRLDAPQVAYEQADGVVTAEGGVNTFLREGLRAAEPLLGSAGGGQPTRVESREAFWREQPAGVLFRGAVRAWQGDNVILAEWLRGDQPERRVTAGGGVRTVAVPPPTAEEPEPAPLTVTAQELEYRGGAAVGAAAEADDRGAGGEPARLVYRRDVEARHQGRIMACQRLQVNLGEGNRTESLVGEEAVRLEDPAAGKRARAERALWQTDEERVALFGAPAVVTDDQGLEVSGPELLYDFATGRVQGRVPPALTPPAAEAAEAEGSEGSPGGPP